MFILDTNVISEPMKPVCDAAVVEWLDHQIAETLFTTAASLSELLLGLERMPHGKRRQGLELALARIEDRFFRGRILPFDEQAARAFSTIGRTTWQKGRAISLADGQIAAIALARGFSVVSRDTKPFEAAGLAVLNPWRT